MWLRLALILAVGAVALLLALSFGPGAVQRRGLGAARAFREQIAPTLAADARFSAVQTSVLTHPALRVHGEVPDEQALQDLEGLVQPPPGAEFRIVVQVKVAAAPATRPAD